MKYYITDENGNLVPVESRGAFSNVTTWTEVGNQTVSVEDSGKTFSLTTASGSAITLPAATEGFTVRFIVGRAFSLSDWVLTTPAQIVNGGAIVDSTFVPAANENTITLTAANSTIGDYFELEVVGAELTGDLQYNVRGNFAQASAVSFSVV